MESLVSILCKKVQKASVSYSSVFGEFKFGYILFLFCFLISHEGRREGCYLVFRFTVDFLDLFHPFCPLIRFFFKRKIREKEKGFWEK